LDERYHLLDRLVAENLAGGGELTAATNEDRLWRAVSEESRVNE